MPLLDVAAIRQAHPVAAVAGGAGVKLRPIAGELRGCCPFHPDQSPSFYVYAGGGRWHCFGCGLTGDVLDFVQRAYSVTMREAAARLCGGDLPLVDAPAVTARTRDNSFALGLWQSAAPIDGTPAEAYLRSRGIMSPLPPVLRFARLRPPKDSGVAVACGPHARPALVALVTDAADNPTGLQRTFLTTDGRKAPSTDGKVKFSLGRVMGGAIRLGPAQSSGMALCEGVEDALSLMEMGAASAWAAAGSGFLPGMVLPDSVQSVIIGADADPAGRVAAARAASAFARNGRESPTIFPTGGAIDFNQELCAGSAEAA